MNADTQSPPPDKKEHAKVTELMNQLLGQMKKHCLVNPEGQQTTKDLMTKGFDVVTNQTDDEKLKEIEEQIDEVKFGYSTKKEILESFLEKCLLNFFLLNSIQDF